MNLFANFIANSPIEMMKNRQAFLSLHRTKENPYGKRKSLETLLRISQILEVDIRELLISSKQ